MQSITEGDIWNQAYQLDNYEIVYDNRCLKTDNKKICAIYFSSSGIYYPNTENELKKCILEKNYYEWKKHKIQRAYKHIYVRDVSKNFYVIGINHCINSIDSLIDFLRDETEGYEIITIGSSGGAYMAALAGLLLDAKTAYCFSCFWSLNHINYNVWHLVGKYQNDKDKSKYYDLTSFLGNKRTNVIYVYPSLNDDVINNDLLQSQFVKNKKNVYSFSIKSRLHGVCMNGFLLDEFINAPEDLILSNCSKISESEMSLALKILGWKQFALMIVFIVRTRVKKIISKIKTI